MKDKCGYHEITMLAEDRVSTSVPVHSVYTIINNREEPVSEDPFEADDDRDYGLSRDNPHVVKTTSNVVVLPSINKWNCFSVRDHRTVDLIGSRDNMNTTTSVSPTSTLEINNLYKEQNVTLVDYPVQAGRSSGSELTTNNSGYRRLTLREKVAKQRSERETDVRSSASTSVEKPSSTRLTKATSLEGKSASVTNHHRATLRSQSNDAITEERTVFGFKILKGLKSSSAEAGNNNTSTGFTRNTSLRQPVRTTNYSTTNRFRDKTENTLFYTPKSTRLSETKSKGVVELEERDNVKGRQETEEGSKEKKAEKLLIRAESLREGKSRLEEFREKQRRGKLTRSLTNPDYEQSENIASSKAKNISESLAEIRERIRERRRKKEQLKKSQSLPETDVHESREITTEHSDDIKENLRKHKEVELKKEMDGHVESQKDSRLNELEYSEIEENSKLNDKERDKSLAIIDNSSEERILRKTMDEEVVSGKVKWEVSVDTKVEVENTRVQKDLNTMDKDDSRVDDKDDKKIEHNKIALNEREEIQETTSFSKQKDLNDASKSKTETCLSNDANNTASQSEQSKSEVKKPTKRERRRLERYQRSKTMSAIMYNEISLDARREMQHKGQETKSEKNSESLAVPSVLEMKKKFMETESAGANSKISDLGLFYSGKTPGTTKSSSSSKTAQKVSGKDEETRSKTRVSRRNILATETTFQNKVAQDNDAKTSLAKNNDSSITDKTKQTKTKLTLSRRHTLPSFTIDIYENKQSEDGHSTVSNAMKEVPDSGGRLPLRRHTFCSQTNWMISRHSPVKLSESVEALKEKFSNLATSSGKASSTKTVENDSNEGRRRRVRSDSSVETKSIAEKPAKEINEGTTSGSSLIRRHTIANRPTLVRQNSEKDKEERQRFFEKFLAKDDETETFKKSEERKITNDVELKREEGRQVSKHTRKDKEDKLSVSKLRKLFLGGQASQSERKTKLRDRRAKTIAGGISPEIMKELDINKGADVIFNKYVKPDVYVSDTTQENAKKERDLIETSGRRQRRSSDLNPDSYLSPKQLSPEETGKDFGEEKPTQDEVSSDVKTPTESEMNKASSVSAREETLSEDTVESKETSSDVIDLKSPTETSFSVPIRRRSGSESDMNKISGIKDQCLDDYLTTIKTMVESPKPQRKSPRSSPQKGKFTSSESFDQDEPTNETKHHLNVVKTSLSMHSWSTSDLDKLIHGGDGASPSASQVDISSMDFDEISSSTTRLQSLTEGRAKTRPKRTISKSLNPMKSLMERTDVRTNTEEPEEENVSKSGFEKAKKRSNPRKKRSQLEPWRRHTLDPVALAALASREDFARVSLRKTKGPGKEKDEYDGSLPVMLIQIKGRRQVQTRLVEPSLSSLNTGDCFILVTPKEIFCWIGMHANTIEKAKAVEISSKIQKRGDMNCKTGDVLYIDETKQGNNLAYRKFCKILEGDTTFPIEDAQLCPDDEFYEREVISTNKVYKLQEGDPPHLIPVTELCGYMPRIGILNTKEVFVFDFGSELYVWTGQQSLSAKRKVAFHLAEMLYSQQFDCDTVVSPIDPRRPMKRSQSSKPIYRDAEGKERGRPTWTLFARLHEKAETLLFQEKFFDWPDPTKIIKMKGHVSSGEIQERPQPVELKPCEPTEMLKPASDLEPAILEATNLGRGLGTPNIEVNGESKEGDLVTTLGMTVWLVTQNKHFVLPKSSEGHFHSGDGYVIRWVYFVAKNRIVRDRRGRIRPLTGRQRCAYFFWQGNECSVNEKGAAAITTVELDEEHGPQIRVVEGKEPPHFLKLFDGAMVIHSGKRIRVSEEQDSFSDESTVRMYCIRNEDTSEGCLVQVTRSASSLRSRSSFVVVDSEEGNIFVWHGCKTNGHHRKVAEKAANFIKERRPIEMNLSEEVSMILTEMEEGQESDIFWTTVSGKKNSHLSLLEDPLNYDFCPRLFHMTSATGQFTFTEILCPSRHPGRTCPFPVLQDDLYSATQPAMFLLDVGDEVYVWEGWMPTEITKDKRGSAKRRWDEERKLTLQTTLSYIKEANNRITKGAYVVQAGLEPLSFTSHFPFWNRIQSITEIKEIEGKRDCEKKPVKETLDNFTQKYYSFQELTSDNPPDGVDPSKLENYLTDDEFQKIFEMSRELFSKLPGWKQDILKKALGLF